MKFRSILPAALLLPALILACSCTRNPILLRKDALSVHFYPDKPVFQDLIVGRDTLRPSLGKGLTINGVMKPWKEWKVRPSTYEDSVVFRMELADPAIGADFVFRIDSSAIRMNIRNVSDPENRLQDIGFGDQPWVSVSDTSWRWWTVKNWTREAFVPKKIFSRGIGYYNTIEGRAGDTVQQKGQPFFACLWNPRKFCAAVKTNTDVYPIRIWSDSAGCHLAPNTYHYRLKDKRMPDFEARLSFIGDLNGNSRADKGDYFLWCNRQIKGPDELHRNAIWYKIKINDAGNRDHPCSNLAQSKEIIDYIRNITDGIPQIIYLVGWQYDGHDTGYPAWDRLNPRMGTRDELLALSEHCDSLHSVLSIHCNMDDAYKGNKYFTPEIMATDYDGSPMFWEIFADSAFHISHYKDVKTGLIFKRLEELFNVFPVHRSIHFDAMRVTNCNPDWEPERIGVPEEYELGLKPIIEWMNRRGVYVTTETQNGNPVDLSPIVFGMWTYFRLTPEYRQIYHGKIVGGGIPEFDAPLEYSSGLGSSITQDFSYLPYAGHLDYQNHRDHMKELIYLGSILYQFLIPHELLEMSQSAEGYRARFSDGIVSVYDRSTNHLKVTWNDLVIAEDGDRFIPTHGGLYVYSQKGADREWTLPEAFRNRKLQVYELTAQGRKPFGEYTLSGDRIRIRLRANQSVRILPD